MSETTIRPFLMFQGRAMEAIALYTAVLPGARVESLDRYGAEGPGPEGTVRQAVLRIADQTVILMDSFVTHAFGFTPAVSFFIESGSRAEVERVHAALAEGGEILMPPGDYGFGPLFSWVNDRFGVSWQLNLRA